MKPTSFTYIAHNRSREDVISAGVGGTVEVFTAGASLNTGDVVYLSAANTVNKSATVTNYAGFIGVVVGGKLTNMNIIPDKTGVAAATTGQNTIVQLTGIALVVAGGTVTAGTNFSVMADSGTAGRVAAGVTAGQMIGTALTTGASAGDMKILIGQR
jgi:hypothetical protein